MKTRRPGRCGPTNGAPTTKKSPTRGRRSEWTWIHQWYSRRYRRRHHCGMRSRPGARHFRQQATSSRPSEARAHLAQLSLTPAPASEVVPSLLFLARRPALGLVSSASATAFKEMGREIHTTRTETQRPTFCARHHHKTTKNCHCHGNRPKRRLEWPPKRIQAACSQRARRSGAGSAWAAATSTGPCAPSATAAAVGTLARTTHSSNRKTALRNTHTTAPRSMYVSSHNKRTNSTVCCHSNISSRFYTNIHVKIGRSLPLCAPRSTSTRKLV